MKEMLAKAWWIVALRGVAAVLFGLLAWFWPGLTLLFLIGLFAAFAILSGVGYVAGALQNRAKQGWWLILLLGLVNIGAGVFAFFYPGVTAFALVIIIAVNAIFSGVLDISTAIRLRKEIEGEWMLALSGLVSIVFGGMLIVMPGAGALALVWVIAAFSIAAGILLIFLGFRLKSHAAAAPAAA
jgi:uncharacterized membrane protein HdeD (DUF308 family)